MSREPEEPLPPPLQLSSLTTLGGGGEGGEPVDPSLLCLPELNLEVEPQSFMLGLGEEEMEEEEDLD